MSAIRWLAAVALGCALACGGPRASAPTDPRQPVRAYFAAVRDGDCPRLRSMVTGAAKQRLAGSGCEDVLREFTEHGAQLLGVVRVRKDGRAPDRRLVDAQIRVGSDTRTIVVGVREVEGSWVVEEI